MTRIDEEVVQNRRSVEQAVKDLEKVAEAVKSIGEVVGTLAAKVTNITYVVGHFRP